MTSTCHAFHDVPYLILTTFVIFRPFSGGIFSFLVLTDWWAAEERWREHAAILGSARQTLPVAISCLEEGVKEEEKK